MDEYDCNAAAGAVEIDNITADAINREILCKLKGNDPNFIKLYVSDTRDGLGENMQYCYCPQNARDLKLLGYFIGENTILKEWKFDSNPFRDINNDAIESFCGGVNHNRSIEKIQFERMDLSGGEIFQLLGPFFENNHNLSEIEVEWCIFGPGCARRFSLALIFIPSKTSVYS